MTHFHVIACTSGLPQRHRRNEVSQSAANAGLLLLDDGTPAYRPRIFFSIQRLQVGEWDLLKRLKTFIQCLQHFCIESRPSESIVFVLAYSLVNVQKAIENGHRHSDLPKCCDVS